MGRTALPIGFDGVAMQPYLDFTQYPNIPGAQPRETSIAAGLEIRERADSLRARAMDFLRLSPMTADEVAAVLDESVLAIRPRVTELAKQGRIEDSGERRQNRSGRSAIVWRVTEEKRDDD